MDDQTKAILATTTAQICVDGSARYRFAKLVGVWARRLSYPGNEGEVVDKVFLQFEEQVLEISNDCDPSACYHIELRVLSRIPEEEVAGCIDLMALADFPRLLGMDLSAVLWQSLAGFVDRLVVLEFCEHRRPQRDSTESALTIALLEGDDLHVFKGAPVMPGVAFDLRSGPSDSSVRPPVSLLREKLRTHDAILMTVTKIGPQNFSGVVEHVYSRRFEGPRRYESPPLTFVSSGGAWGNKDLNDSERALVFLRYLHGPGKYYQPSGSGHFSIANIRGERHAIANWHLLDPRGPTFGPGYLRESAFFEDPSKPWQVALPFRLLEKHLLEELALLDNAYADERTASPGPFMGPVRPARVLLRDIARKIGADLFPFSR